MLLITKDAFKEPVVVGTGYITGRESGAVSETVYESKDDKGEPVKICSLSFILTAKVKKVGFETGGNNKKFVKNIQTDKEDKTEAGSSSSSAGALKSGDGGTKKVEEMYYQNINCGLSLKKSTYMMYKLLKDAKRGERVNIMGTIKQRTYTAWNGATKVYEEVELESVVFPNRLAALLLGVDEDKKIKRELEQDATDGALMDAIGASGDETAVAAIDDYAF